MYLYSPVDSSLNKSDEDKLFITYDAYNEYQDLNETKNRLYWMHISRNRISVTESVTGELELMKSQKFIDDVKHILHVNWSYGFYNYIHITYRTDQGSLGLAVCRLVFSSSEAKLSVDTSKCTKAELAAELQDSTSARSTYLIG